MTKTTSSTTNTTNKPVELKFYNYRTRQIDAFRPLGREVGLYTCGPTVYNVAHIGNFRTYIFEDLLRRNLEYFGYPVRHVMNLTDVEDKIIMAAGKASTTITEYTAPFIERFYADMAKLNIRPAHDYPKATEHIPEMIALIEQLLAKGLAYESDGSIYFAIRKFPAYGKLAGIALSGLKAGARVDVDEYDKEAAEDFVLWKASRPTDQSVGAVWDSPWGQGRPGWHIECSAMSMKYLGQTFDLHAGGIDLLFPHHEDEIAQSEGATGKAFANVFLEGDHILVENHKMAKSAGNFVTLQDLAEKGIDPLAFRYLMLGAHYRTKLNFTWESVTGAARALEALRELQYREAKDVTKEVTTKIDAALANDLDVPAAVAILHEENNPALWEHYDAVLGLGLKTQQVRVSADMEQLLAQRETARKEHDFARADALRDELKAKGWEIEDTAAGPRLIPVTRG